MSFARTPTDRLTPAKPTGGQKLKEGAAGLTAAADKINRDPNVQAAKNHFCQNFSFKVNRPVLKLSSIIRESR